MNDVGSWSNSNHGILVLVAPCGVPLITRQGSVLIGCPLAERGPELIQGDPSGWLKPPVDLVPTDLAGGGLHAAQAGWWNISNLLNGAFN